MYLNDACLVQCVLHELHPPNGQHDGVNKFLLSYLTSVLDICAFDIWCTESVYATSFYVYMPPYLTCLFGHWDADNNYQQWKQYEVLGCVCGMSHAAVN